MRRDITNQIFFIFIIILIIFLLWGYGSGWFGASADVNAPQEQQGFVGGVVHGLKKLQGQSVFQDERDWKYAL